MNWKHGCTIVDARDRTNPLWKTHYTWLSMKSRCTREKDRNFKNYGGRGITFDPAWEDFQMFLNDMGFPPSPKHTIERIDNEGPYCKDNCRWATRTEQGGNKRNNRYLEFKGERMIVADWARRLGVEPRLIWVRLGRGWSVEDTLSRAPDAAVGRFR